MKTSLINTWIAGAVLCISSFVSFPLYSDEAVQKDGVITISEKDCSDSQHEDASGKVYKPTIELDCKTYMQTTLYTCGPAAVMTLLLYYKKMTDADMTPKTELHIALEMGATGEGTTLIQMTTWLKNHGFNVDAGVKVNSDMIIENLKKGIPTVLSTNRHWILAKGYIKGATPNDDQIVFSDSCCSTTILSKTDIDQLWAASQLPGNSCGTSTVEYIIATPK